MWLVSSAEGRLRSESGRIGFDVNDPKRAKARPLPLPVARRNGERVWVTGGRLLNVAQPRPHMLRKCRSEAILRIDAMGPAVDIAVRLEICLAHLLGVLVHGPTTAIGVDGLRPGS